LGEAAEEETRRRCQTLKPFSRTHVSATQTLMSGKRNNLEDFVFVELERPRVLRSDDRELDPLLRALRTSFEYLFDTPEDQFPGRTTFGGRATFQAPIDRIRDVDGRSHNSLLPYLWSTKLLFVQFNQRRQDLGEARRRTFIRPWGMAMRSPRSPCSVSPEEPQATGQRYSGATGWLTEGC